LRLGLSIALGVCLLLAACVLSANFGLSPLWAQAVSPTDRAPNGWYLAGSKPAAYRSGVDKEALHDGQPSAYLQSTVTKTEGFGTLMQTIDAAEYAGKRVRLRAAVKSQSLADWAGLWMRVDKDQTMGAAFDNMQDRGIKGTQAWGSYDVVLDVPSDATRIAFGILLSGEGQVWMNHVTFEIVDTETQVTGYRAVKPSLSKKPVNLSFSE
jgi:hypothetical protein